MSIRLRHWAVAWGGLAGISISARPALAFEAAVDSSTVLQIYSVRSPWGAPILSRQRLTHTLALEAFRPPADPRESKWTLAVHARLRLDGDYGVADRERDPTAIESFVPSVFATPVDLSYGYLEARDLLNGNLSARLGRQLIFNEFGFWSYDGAEVALTPGGLFELSGFAGYEQRGGVPFLSTSRYEPDGVYRGDRAGMPANFWPSYLNSTAPAPAYGATLALRAFPWLRARTDYRRVNQHDTVVTVPFADASGRLRTFSGNRVSSERVGVGLGADIAERASFDAAWVHDLYRRVTQSHRLQASYRGGSRWRVTAGYQYVLPVFDADSIFNWFGARGSVLAQSSLAVRLSKRVDVTVSGGARWLGIGPRQWLDEVLGPGPETGIDGLLRIESSYVLPSSSLGAQTVVEMGDAGDRWSSDLWYRQAFWTRRMESQLRVGAGRWRHPLMAEHASSSFLYVASLRYYPGGRPEFGAEWEHVLLEHAAHRFRFVGTMSVRWP